MTEYTALSAEEIERAVDVVKGLRPAYTNLLDFYKQIFIAQEDSALHLDMEPIKIPKNKLSIKLKEAFPLINMSEFIIDESSSEQLFSILCRIALNATDVMPDSVQKIVKARGNGGIVLRLLFKNLLNENDEYFKNMADEIQIEDKVLVFLAYHSIKPSLSVCSHQLSNYLASSNSWEKGCCPICGNLPGISILEDDGGRSLFCGFCRHKWHVQRIFCPFCEDETGTAQNYFYSEEEPGYRVDTCDKCKKYIKTVDAREIGRRLYPDIEQVSTLHLDMKAKEMGFGSPLFISM
ncbi:MAG: formate dehydrogenase accessory protein FdhE [Desulfobacterales bacterium]|nr:formate dehydrogenase accessory protein FdhE [Desulfobacterales bacterium]